MLYDAVVIGGGPVGSRVAYGLAGTGCRVVVIEKKERIDEPVCCTGIISQECVSQFAVDVGVILRRVNGARLFSPSGKLLSLRREEPQACIVDRAAFNMALASRAQDRGVEYVLDSPVRSIEVRNDRVRIGAGRYGASLSIFEARAAVIAGGFGSRLVEQLGLGRAGDCVAGAQAEVETTGVDEVEVYLGRKIAPAFFAWLVPTSPQRALVGLLSRRRPGFYLRRLILSLVSQRKIASAETEIRYGGIPLRPPGRTYSNRVVVVGSAAGQVKPTTGGGIYYGLLCADIAAECLQRALKNDDLSARSLAGYEKEWRRKLGRELKIGYWARKFYELLSDRQIDGIFDIIKSSGIDEALLRADDLTFDWHGGVIVRLVGEKALSHIFGGVKVPFLRRQRS